MAVPAVPAACQPLQAQVTGLSGQYTSLVAQSKGLTGQAGWAALAQLGSLREQVAAAQAELAQCVATHSAAVTGTVVVIDVSGAAAPGAQAVTLWDITGGVTAAHDVAPVQAGAFGLQGPVPAQAALTVQTTGQPDITGVDFRSGALVDAPGDANPRIEIVLGPTIHISAAELFALASTIQPLNVQVPAFSASNPTPAPLGLTCGGFGLALSQGVVTLQGQGTIVGGFVGGESPFTVSISAVFTPSADPQSANLLDVALSGSQPISASIGGALAGLTALVGTLTDLLAPPVRQALSDEVNASVSAAVAGGLALAALPPGVRVSLRSLTIDETGIRYQPALGAIGTILSSFAGTPLPLP